MTIDHVTHQEKAEIIAATRAAAVTMSKLWYLLENVEDDDHEFVNTTEIVTDLAAWGDLDIDGTSDAQIWEQVEHHWRKIT